MSSSRRLGVAGSGGRPVTWRPGGPIWSAAVGEGGAGLWSSPAGLQWAGDLQCARLCGLACAGGNSSCGLRSGAGGGGGASWGVCGGRVRATGRAGRAVGRGAPCGGCVRVAGCGGWCVVFGGWVRGGRVRLFGRVGEALFAGPGAARNGGRVWAAGWVAGGEGQGRGLRGEGCCICVCVRLQRRARVVSCRPGGLEVKLAVFCGRGKDLADEHSYLVHLLVSVGKRVC